MRLLGAGFRAVVERQEADAAEGDGGDAERPRRKSAAEPHDAYDAGDEHQDDVDERRDAQERGLDVAAEEAGDAGGVLVAVLLDDEFVQLRRIFRLNVDETNEVLTRDHALFRSRRCDLPLQYVNDLHRLGVIEFVWHTEYKDGETCTKVSTVAIITMAAMDRQPKKTTRKTSRPKPVSKRPVVPANPQRGFDITAIIVLALGVFSVIALLSKNAGVVGSALENTFRILFGVGAWAAPVLLFCLGVGLIRGRGPAAKHLSWGLGLLFLALLSALAKSSNGDYFDTAVIVAGGGYIGAMLGYAFHMMLGAGQVVGTVMLGLIGLVLTIDMPIRDALGHVKRISLPPAQEPREVTPKEDVPPPKKRPIGMEPEPERVVAHEEPAPPKPKKAPNIREIEEREPSLSPEASTPKEGYQLPPINLLAESILNPKRSPAEMQKNIETLENTLEQFGIEATVVEVATGPSVTRYEIQLGAGVRVARITALADNIAMDLAASQVRVEAPIPGKAAIGVEVPNASPTIVTLRELCESQEFIKHSSRLCVALGKDVSGMNKYADLTKMPHLLIGGATNSGKSIGLATLITSLLMRNTPKDLRLVLIDPKRVELTLFDRIPHLMCPVIKDVKEAPGVLRAVWREMDRRFDLISEVGVRNIDGWNAKASFQDRMPYIVVVIDELADLMIQAKAEVETTIVRLAQLSRAVGIHLVIATQRPSVDVITGLIKANIPSRIAFSVASQIDARTILDTKGAEDLIGKGDMLFSPIEANKPVRIQGCYVSEQEIDAVCKFWRNQQAPDYVLKPVEVVEDSDRSDSGGGSDEVDALWQDAVRWVVERGQASTSMLQRRFSIGFQRASRLLDEMEQRAIVGPKDGARPREVMINPVELEEMFGRKYREAGDSTGNDE